jgi:L-lactate transport
MPPTWSPTWHQTYALFGSGLAVSALIAALPTAILLYLLAIRRRPSWIAALAGLAATLAIALVAYRMPLAHAVSSAAYGVAFGLFPISWIVFWALILYEITLETGNFELIKNSIGSLTADPRLQSLLIAFCFGAFIEGCAGFGTPVAVAAAMMAGLGFSSLYASQLCLLANTAPVAFGSIGIPLITLAGITGLPLAHLSAVAGRLTAPLSLLLPAYLILVTSGFAAMLEVWPAVLTCGAAFALVQFFVSTHLGPQLADILASISAMAALILLLRFWKPRPQSESSTTTNPGAPSMKVPPSWVGSPPPHPGAPGSTVPSSTLGLLTPPPTTPRLWLAWTPYALLVLFVLAWGSPPIAALLNHATIAFPWPGLHNHIIRMPPVVSAPSPYAAIFNFNWLSASGTACMGASLVSALLLRLSPRDFARVVLTVARRLTRPTITVTAMLAMAFVMNYSGATGTLGLAFASTGRAFPFFSPLMGWLGVFLTGSDTSSNALFGNLQVVSAARLGLNPILIAAGNSIGGVTGKMISLQTIAVAAAATGMSTADQSRLFRFTLRHSIFLASLVGLEVTLYAYLFRSSF